MRVGKGRMTAEACELCGTPKAQAMGFFEGREIGVCTRCVRIAHSVLRECQCEVSFSLPKDLKGVTFILGSACGKTETMLDEIHVSAQDARSFRVAGLAENPLLDRSGRRSQEMDSEPTSA